MSIVISWMKNAEVDLYSHAMKKNVQNFAILWPEKIKSTSTQHFYEKLTQILQIAQTKEIARSLY
jgi:hypothetical protein